MDTTAPLDAGAARRAEFRRAVAQLQRRAAGADLVRALLLPGSVALLAGFACILLAWWGSAHSFREIEQIPYLISGGLLGLGLVVVGALALASAVVASVVRRAQVEADERAARQLEVLVERLRAELASAREPAGNSTTRPSGARRTRRA